MRCLLVGSGGRESALAWKLSRSPLLKSLFLYPGSPSTSCHGTMVEAHEVDPVRSSSSLSDPGHLKQLARWAVRREIDLVFCGPEAPLCAGLADIFQEQGILVWGCTEEVALLEGSKVFAKELMKEAAILQADYELATNQQQTLQLAGQRLQKEGGVVVKADGLAGGKGVFVCKSREDLQLATGQLFSSSLAEASSTVVIERLLQGEECSYFAWVHGPHVEFLGFARDYKRLLTGDQGVNTGGMGCYTPLPWLPGGADVMVKERVILPLIEALKKRGLFYSGFLYGGLMWGEEGPQVLEFNIRLGDPECQALVVADDRDWLALSWGMLQGDATFAPSALKPVVCAVLASPCYPWKQGPLEPVCLPDEIWQTPQGVHVFGGALKQDQEGIFTHRGRVLTVVCEGETLAEARSKLYDHIQLIRERYWSGFQMRTDIALLTPE